MWSATRKASRAVSQRPSWGWRSWWGSALFASSRAAPAMKVRPCNRITAHPQQTTEDIAMTSRTDRSIPELFSDAVGQLAKLIGNEFALARAELAEKAGD